MTTHRLSTLEYVTSGTYGKGKGDLSSVMASIRFLALYLRRRWPVISLAALQLSGLGASEAESRLNTALEFVTEPRISVWRYSAPTAGQPANAKYEI